MMSDKEFAELELKATICPHQIRWPKDALHWRKLHDATDEARARVTKAYTEMDEIDRNSSLSSDIKYRRRCEIADQAIADFEASKTLARAREAVELALAKRNSEQHVSPEIAEARDATLKALKEPEHGWQRAMDKIAERAGLNKSPGIRR